MEGKQKIEKTIEQYIQRMKKTDLKGGGNWEARKKIWTNSFPDMRMEKISYWISIVSRIAIHEYLSKE